MTTPIVEQARAIARAIRDHGGRAVVVGGFVRDRLLGNEAKDLDLEVFGLEAVPLRELLAGFGPVNIVGEAFTVYKIGAIDVALPRRESKSGRGHRGFIVAGDPMMSFADAARRRDFTINAIGWNPLTDEYLDPWGGRGDLEARVLRAVDPAAFPDDSLRVLRAAQFAARFECEIAEETRALCRTINPTDLPAERIWGELEKLLLRARRPSRGLKVMLDLGTIDRLFPEIKALVGCEQEPDWHPEGDVWVHTLLVVDEARSRIDDLPHAEQVAIMLGAVLHDLGKPLTTARVEGRIRSLNHEEAGVVPATRVLDRLKVHTLDGYDVRRQVLGMVAHHLKPGMWHKSRNPVGDGAFRRLAQKVDLKLLARLAKADCLGRTRGFNCSAMDWFLDRARRLGVEHAPPKPILLGRYLLELGVDPGPRMGEILRHVYERQLDGDVTTLDDALALARTLIR